MANPQPRLDLNLAIKLIDKYNGEAEKLAGFFETIDLLKDYSEGVVEMEIIRFVKTRLIGPAYGCVNTAVTLNATKTLLRQKFAVRFSPQAVESEMSALRQNRKTVSEYGQEINELAAMLAAAHVSKGTFNDEAAADAIVQPVAVKSFINGLKDPKAQFFLKARNPKTLTKAISDALEVTNKEDESVMWLQAGSSRPKAPFFKRGRGGYQRGNTHFRGGSRGRGHGYNRGRGNSNPERNQYDNYRYQNRNSDNYQNQNDQYHSYSRGNHQGCRGAHRGRNDVHLADANGNTAHQQGQGRSSQQEHESNLIDLFRE